MAKIEISWNDKVLFDTNLAILLDRYIAARENAPGSKKTKSLRHSRKRLEAAYELRDILNQEPDPLSGKGYDYYQKIEAFEEMRHKVRKKKSLVKSDLKEILEYAAKKGFAELFNRAKTQDAELREFAARPDREQTLQAEINSLRQEGQNLFEEKQTYKKSAEAIDEDKTKKDDLIRTLTTELEEAQTELKATQDRLRIVEQKTQTEKQHLEKRLEVSQSPKRQTQEVQKLTKQMLRDQVEMAALKQKNSQLDSLEKQVKRFKIAVETAKDINIQTTQDFEKKVAETTDMQQKMFAAIHQAEGLKKEIAELTQLRQDDGTALEEMGNVLQENVLTIQKLQNTIAEREQSIARATTMLRGNVRETERKLLDDINQLKQERKNDAVLMENANRQQLSTNDALRKSEAKNKQLEASLTQAKEDNTTLQQELNEVKEERNTLKRFVKILCELPGVNKIFKAYKKRHGEKETQPVEKIIGQDFNDLPQEHPQAASLREGTFLAKDSPIASTPPVPVPTPIHWQEEPEIPGFHDTWSSRPPAIPGMSFS